MRRYALIWVAVMAVAASGCHGIDDDNNGNGNLNNESLNNNNARVR